MAQHYPLADDSYEQDYEKIKEQFGKKIQKFNNKPEGSILNELKRDVDDASNTVRLIEQEINSLPQDQRNNQRNKIRRYREEVEKMKKQYKDAELHAKDASDLLGNSTEDSDRYNSQGNRNGGAFQKLAEQNRKLKDATRQVYDIEGQGNQICEVIYKQNEQLDRMNKDNREITQELSTSNKLLDRIHRNIVKRKATMYAVIGFLLFCLLIIIMSWF